MSSCCPTEIRITDLRALVQSDFDACNTLIHQQIDHKIPLIQDVLSHLIQAGGKRLRPLVLLLSANACQYQGQAHIHYATAIEFIHTATLLHDDVVDNSALRRGLATAHEVWGRNTSILMGDFLYSRAFELLAAFDHPRVLQNLARATNRMSEGEILQLTQVGDITLSLSDYQDTIDRKTAGLFSAASATGALLSDTASDAWITACKQYGHHLGMAFQIIDDSLDYRQENQSLDKHIGDDLAEQKMTLPLIIAHTRLRPDAQKKLCTQIKKGRDALDEICAVLVQTQSIEACIEHARQHVNMAQQALHALPDSPYRQALHDIATLTLDRNY